MLFPNVISPMLVIWRSILTSWCCFVILLLSSNQCCLYLPDMKYMYWEMRWFYVISRAFRCDKKCGYLALLVVVVFFLRYFCNIFINDVSPPLCVKHIFTINVDYQKNYRCFELVVKILSFRTIRFCAYLPMSSLGLNLFSWFCLTTRLIYILVYFRFIFCFIHL